MLTREIMAGEDRKYLESALAESGIYKIPSLQFFDERYHEVQTNQIIAGSFVVIREGWASRNKVYRKAIIVPSS